MPPTVKSLDERLDKLTEDMAALSKELAAFSARIETVVSLLKWGGGFAATVVVALIFNGFAVARSAGRLEAAVGYIHEDVKTIEGRLGPPGRTVSR